MKSKRNQNHFRKPDFRKHTNKKIDQKLAKITGILSVNTRGVGFIKPLVGEEDIEIQNADLQTALNGDEVEVVLLSSRKGQRPQGKVLAIKNRAKRRFAGVLRKENNNFILSADDKKMYADIIVSPANVQKMKAQIGDKVLVQIIQWEKTAKGPQGEIIQVLGRHGEHNAEMQSIVLERGFEIDFPTKVEAEAEHIEKTEKPIPREEIVKRRDFRDTPTFTIDPITAKDFDDAISFKKLGDNLFEIGVHIADVSHYVREKSALDEESLKREFSVYLVDRTIPMLPEVLSNDICSLNPNEERLTFSAVFEMDRNGNISKRWFGKTVIKSTKRFSYEEAQGILDKKSGNYFDELNTLNEIAKKMRATKERNGAIDFEQDEIAFDLDPTGKPLRIYRKQRVDTHKLVEEYMLLANREVAEFIFKAYKKINSDSPFIYRIHDLPNKEKIAQLGIFVKALGHDLKMGKNGEIGAKDFQELFRQIEGRAEESMIKTAAIRSMAKAIYSTKNIGHFGLAFEYYTHFTSPIRRYPDLLVHRLLEKHLTDQKLSKSEWIKYEKIAERATEQEVKAAEAERDSKKYKQIEFMMDKVGQTFSGVISGVTEWGLYVEEAETRSEGMVKIRDLGNDYYNLDKKNYAIVGERTKKKFSLGDKVKFQIVGADLERKTLDLKLL